MFYRKSIFKEETIIVGTDNGDISIHLVINHDEPVMDVVISGANIPTDNTPYWHLFIEGYGLYFDIRELVTELIYNCDNLDEFINCLDEVLLDSYYDNLIESSFDDYENRCEECADKDSCEEYLKHRN